MNAFTGSLRTDAMLPDQREVLEYWSGIRNGRTLPARGDFRPAQIQKRLPFVSLVDVSADLQRFRFRLAGTGLRDSFGLELTGRFVDDLPLGDQGELWRGMYREVARTARPASGFTTLAWRGRPHIVQAWLRLPLCAGGDGEGNVTTILGYDRFIAVERKTLRDIASERLPLAALTPAFATPA